MAITRWTDSHELFVEFPAPQGGKPVRFHAHVTRLQDFGAVVKGQFRVRFKKADGSIAAEGTADGVARAGIFKPEVQAPPNGTYVVEMVYENEGATDLFDCGSITVADNPAPPVEPKGISFLKESQWKIPFATALSQERSFFPEQELATTVEPSALDEVTISAPVGGRFLMQAEAPLVEGRAVTRGSVVASVVPGAGADDFTRMQNAVEDVAVSRAQVEREILRVAPLVEQGVRQPRDLIELKNQLEMWTVKERQAQERLARVTNPQAGNGVTVKAPLSGVIAAVLARPGDVVAMGAPLLRVRNVGHTWLRSRLPMGAWSDARDARPVALRLPNGTRVELEGKQARFVSATPVLDPGTRTGTWVVDIPEASMASLLPVGSSAVLLFTLEEPRKGVMVPSSAVVELNTRPFVFVQVSGETFEKRAVDVGGTGGGWTEVRRGVSAHEHVVTIGGFDVHLGQLMGTIESHRH